MFWKNFKLVGLVILLGALLCTPPAFATVSSTYTPSQVAADGNKTEYDFTFKVFNTADLDVVLVNQTSLNTTNQTLGVDYTASLLTATPGGSINFTTTPNIGWDVYIARDMAVTQTTDIPAGGLFREVQIENALDKLTMLIQQQEEVTNRALLQTPYGNYTTILFPVPSTNKLIGWNLAGTELENKIAVNEDDVNATAVSAAAAVVSASQAANNATLAQAAQVASEAAQAAAESAVNNTVNLTGNQTVNGTKTFGSFPVLPSSSPTTDYQAATKKYVDDHWPTVYALSSATNITTASASLEEMNGMNQTIAVSGNYLVMFSAPIRLNEPSSNKCHIALAINGTAFADTHVSTEVDSATERGIFPTQIISVANVTAGQIVTTMWSMEGGGTAYQDGATYGKRNLIIMRYL